LKNQEAYEGRLNEKENGVEPVVALASRDSCGNQAGKIKSAAHEVYGSQGKKVRQAFQQRVENVDWYKECEQNEESTMIGLIVRFVIDGFVHIAFTRKE
jgi:hypothetical protein